MNGVGYRYEVASLEGLIQQLAQSLLPKGYHFYVQGQVPVGKPPEAVDAKLLARYGVAVSKFTRARRKKLGQANLAYLRLGRTFLLLATHGRHRFFEEERGNLRDARKTPIKHGGYALSVVGGRASVRIERETYQLIKGQFLGAALTRSAEGLESALLSLPFVPYAPVRRQLLEVVRQINRARNRASLPLVSVLAVRWHRRLVKPFERSDGDECVGVTPLGVGDLDG